MLAINIEDVISVLNTCKPYLIGFGVVVVLAIIAMLACGKLSRGRKFLIRGEAALAIVLALAVTVNLICFGPMSSLISLAMGDGSVTDETAASANELCQTIAEEGIVLVKNEGALPLSNTKLNVFGWSSTNPVYGGTGSGGLSESYPTVSLLEGLSNAGIEYNTAISDFYTEFRDSRPTVGMWGQDWTIPEPTMEEYDAAGIFENAKEYSDTALIVISRSGGEGADLPTSYDGEDTFEEGGTWGASGVRLSSQADDLDASKHYLELSNREIAMVERVTSEFDNVIVVINAANAMELGWLDQYDSIKGALVMAGPGQTGFNALGEILMGNVNPSAKMVDTYVYDLTATPTWNNFGHFAYDNVSEFEIEGATPTFVNYNESIYVGYKFYETAAAEGLIDYDATVQYPFGYGLSYTTFTQEMGAISESNGTITFDVTVTNTGDVAGKDVVQVYYNPPYTNGGIEKASANLIAFDKTDLLEPGASQTLTLSFSVEDMASYDTYGAGAYVLEAGDYVISINSDSHNIIDSQTYTVDETVVYDENNARSTDAVAATNQFAAAEGDVTYLSRADGFANYAEATAAPASLSMSDEAKAAFLNNSNYDPNNYNNADDVMPTTGAKNGLTLADLRGVDYDDPQWDSLLDQMTVSEMDTLIAIGGYQTSAINSIGKVQTIDCDGPASINNNFTGKGSIGFPAAVMIAATWNTDLAHDFGERIGKMADEMGVSGWYAPAMNTHRSAFAGRNFEYYSEDGLLGGKMAANAILGAQEHGVYAYMKHFALNDQETNRDVMLCTWSNEQAIREIYLKPFEIAVKEGGCQAVMSSFNYIGAVWAGACDELLNNVLRDEWGFRGFVLTDYFGNTTYMDADQAIRGGTDCMLVAYDTPTNHVTDTTSATSVLAMRQACKNILYTTVNSRAYAEENLTGGGLQGWQVAAIAIDVVLGAVLVAGAVLIAKKAKQKDDTSAQV
ncbi:beta-glucosidase [Flavonifractor sp. An92]|uniref:beta-glucosidase n=1 Tax=Flavonifractor sp. An92 TaxID=1965666 RepID=UPI000B3AAA60|nr:glycoside hydrolase family 3 N-terminal domain-containing protein [Flavonifractor sp. An92]OUN06037.1 beta-glucosidase [Flavonifractor sp. An92]